MPSHSRLTTVVAALLAVSTAGNGQVVAPRAQPIYPQPIPATQGEAGPGYLPGGLGGPGQMAMVDPDKKLSVGDQVTVEILEDREGGFPRMVTATGELDVPPVGRIKVSGKTATEAAGMIKSLLEKDYYYHATVRVGIDRVSSVGVRSGEIYLSGHVRTGGPMEILTGETLTLSNAILKAGGIDEWGDRAKVQITRQDKDGTVQRMTVNFDKIIKSGDAKLDPVLQDGDRVFIDKKFWRGLSD